MTQEGSEVKVVIASSLAHLDALQEIAEALARLAGFNDDGRLDLGLAVREAAINAMKHGNAFSPGTEVEIVFSLGPDAFRVALRDQGPGFDPTNVPDPTAPENILRTSGRGLFLIRSMVDDLIFTRLPRGMEMLLVKRLPHHPAGRVAG